MKMHIATIWALACMAVGMAVVLVPWLATESYEAYEASFWLQLARVAGLTMIATPALMAIGYIVLDWCLAFCAMFRRMNRWTWRKWGVAPGILGTALCVMSPGPDDMPNTMLTMLGAITLGIALVALGWLINHWPPMSYWPYISGRAAVPPHRHIAHISSMGVCDN